ncbi:sensor domain-containing protein [Cohnella mopanensis]|uniref:sensor domain-containing protein n=1 Tax=Cohnella mopanensis TaxID=2911966 RepID=UPI001EF7AA2C|nr:sensor domain-containing protein [Cohnella mopanensis]
MKKMKVFKSWIILLGALPRGIGAFVIAIAGLSVGLPLAVFVIGLPLLAGMLIVCERILGIDRRLLAELDNKQSLNSQNLNSDKINVADIANDSRLKNWRGWLSILGNKQQYWNLVYGIFQFPISILTFVLAVLIPALALGLMLSPVAAIVSTEFFQFDLFAGDWFMNWLFPDWTSFQRSWFNAGLGAVLLLSAPYLIRKLVGCYSAWIRWISKSTDSVPNATL